MNDNELNSPKYFNLYKMIRDDNLLTEMFNAEYYPLRDSEN